LPFVHIHNTIDLTIITTLAVANTRFACDWICILTDYHIHTGGFHRKLKSRVYTRTK